MAGMHVVWHVLLPCAVCDAVTGIKLVGFDQAVDLKLQPASLVLDDNSDFAHCMAGAPFTVEVHLVLQWCDCSDPWQVDYYGVAAVVHALLFGTAMTTSHDSTNTMPSEPLRKYWQVALWDKLFRSLLNASHASITSSSALLSELRSTFERHLSEVPMKAKSLCMALHKLEDRLAEARVAAM